MPGIMLRRKNRAGFDFSGGGIVVRRDRDFEMFITHYDWYTKDELHHYIPTDKAPQEAVEAMKRFNERMDWENKQGAQY